MFLRVSQLKSLFVLLFGAFVFFSCKKEKEPKERIKIKEPAYEFLCMACEQHSSDGVLYDYNTIKFRFKVDDPKNRIKDDSYIKVIWSFNSGASGQYIVDYSKITFSGEWIIIKSDWSYSQFSSNLHVALTLYTGRGSKSNTIELDIPKPSGAVKLM